MALRPDVTNIPAPRVPFIDERTGLVAREWYLFLLNLFINTGGASNLNLAALQMAPAAQDTSALLDQLMDANKAPPAQDLVDLAQRLQDLSVAPALQPEVQKLHYGSFYDMTDQTLGATDTATAITFDSEDGMFGVRRGSPTSRIIVDNPGVYNVQFSLQLDNTSGGDVLVWVWPRIGVTDVPNSMSRHRIKGNDAETVLAWNFYLTFAAGEYFQLMWAADNTNVILDTFAATAFGPATPSAILTVSQVNL